MKKFFCLALIAAGFVLGIAAESEARCRGGRGRVSSRIFHRHHAGGGCATAASGGCSFCR